MAVSQTRYVDITSGVGAATTVAQRQLIGRLFTDNPLLPPQTYLEFSSADDVGAYFGLASNEYLRAQFYFSWVSKNITQAPLISFARWVDTAQAAVIYGAQATYALATFTAVTTGALNLTIGALQATLTAINLSAAGSLAAVASDIQTVIRAHTAGGADWTNSTVSFDAVNSRFNFVGGVAGPEDLVVGVAGSGVDLAPLLGWSQATAIVGQGSAVETVTQTLTTSAGLSNNFGSFLFIPALNQAEVVLAATWNDGQNVLYQYMVPVTASTAVGIQGAIESFAGCAITLAPISTQYPEMVPMIILAATNYNAINSVQDYEFQLGFPGLSPSVLDDTDADTYDALGINYYVQTQNAGQFINFYATGVLTGTATDPVDQNVYANEQWLKSALAAQLMTLLLDLAVVSANTQGVGQITGVLQSVIQQALTNGTISVGKTLDEIQQLYITNATGSNTAYITVQSQGWWLNVVIVPFVVDDVTKYKAVYTLIYSKDDVIRFIQGSDVLI